MASPKTIQLKADAAARSTARWVEIHAAYAESHPSLPLTSTRHLGRTKGLPYSRFVLLSVQHVAGAPARLMLKNCTRGRVIVKRATKELMNVFFPHLPDALRWRMLGF